LTQRALGAKLAAMPHIYGLTDQQAQWASTAANLARDVLSRHAADVDIKARFPEESLAALAKGGFLGLCVPREHGGAAQPPRTFVAVAEELGRTCASTAMIFVMHVSAAKTIEASTTLASRDTLLRDIAAGKHLTTLALSERGSRSNFWAPVSQLAEQGQGFVTSAQKSWVTSAHRADSYVSSGQRPGAASPLESTVYLARRDDRTVRPTSHFDGLGLRGNDSAPVAIEDFKLSKGDLISAVGEGAKTMLEVVLPWFAVGTSGMANGLCRAAVEATGAHLAETRFEHVGQNLRDLPTLRARLAEMSARTEASRALLAYTCGELEQPSATTPLYVLQTRMAALQAALDVTDGAMQACGGAAFSKHLGVERTFRDARAGWVMAPTWDHLADFVGKALTGLPLF
jgi:alkylation response protein AidB-like acyl-CoA dehydrogenase